MGRKRGIRMTKEEYMDRLLHSQSERSVDDADYSDWGYIEEKNENIIEVLEQIRAEIEQLRLHKAQFVTNDNKVCIDSQEVLDIIDKYKTDRG